MIDAVPFSIHQQMVSGRGEAEARTYKLLTGKSGKRWLVAIQDNAGDNVYVEGEKNSDGFGGAILSFPLENGEEIKLKGPWKVSAEGLLADTGYDVTNQRLTFGIVAEDKKYQKWNEPDLYSGVLHHDKDWTIGHYDRIQDIAQLHADRLGKKIFFGVISPGGGYAGWKDPKKPAQVAA